ncbi:MAG: imidazole glycerol phosphate synthase subunit HisH [Rhizomicrobium sp.]
MAIVALIDYGSGNLRSAEKALARAASESGSGQQIVVTADPKIIATAERIVLPGVGAFADCMAGLKALPGMVETLHRAVFEEKIPFLGICVGMQLLATLGREFGDHDGLNWIRGEVVKITPSDPALKIPHMGWNEPRFAKHALFAGLPDGAHVYFVHSYKFLAADPADILAEADYGGPFAAAVGHDNIAGFQFHPEKSQAVGQIILSNFLRWQP